MWFQIKKAIIYYLCSHHKKGHGIHSPFVFEIITQVFRDRRKYPEYDIAKNIFYQLKKNKTKIETPLLGAKASNKKQTLKISNIAKKSTISAKYGQLLFRLVRYFNAQNILELGTCLGLGTTYLALANKKAQVYTIEGSEAFLNIARENLWSNNINNVHLIAGTFEQQLKYCLEQMPTLDFVFIDGNHTYEATLSYFDILAQYAHHNTILVFDDIYWSPQMAQAWEKIKADSRITLTMDIFRMGLVFFRKEIMVKQHFVIRF
ncbi:MAG: class I SAM-dependent methyltransferase [Bacteroidales bacterium]|nr:class I SAM-dependent methyltransferase [Bacteroidales bacterium]